MPAQSPAAHDSLLLDDAALLRECDVDIYRAHGPGGQKRNKTDSAIRLRHRPTGLAAIAMESRSQHQNKQKALRRLRHTLAVQVRRRTAMEGYEPSPLIERYRAAAARARRRPDGATLGNTPLGHAAPGEDAAGAGGLAINTRNPDYPVVLREVLDVLFACDLRVAQAAAHLRVSTSQLVKFIRGDGHAWGHVNQQRAQRGDKPLK